MNLEVVLMFLRAGVVVAQLMWMCGLIRGSSSALIGAFLMTVVALGDFFVRDGVVSRLPWDGGASLVLFVGWLGLEIYEGRTR